MQCLGFITHHNAPNRGFVAKPKTPLRLVALWKGCWRLGDWRGMPIDPKSLWTPKTIWLKEGADYALFAEPSIDVYVKKTLKFIK